MRDKPCFVEGIVHLLNTSKYVVESGMWSNELYFSGLR